MKIFLLAFILIFNFSCSTGKNSEAKRDLASKKTPQYVLLAFDGSMSVPMWHETVEFADSIRNSGGDLKFTYFISAVYYLTQKNRMYYQGPNKKRGASDIGFSEDDLNTLKDRIEATNLAYHKGHEIASHAVGHFDGGAWTTADWINELKQFDDIVFNSDKINKVPARIQTTKSELRGLRAPLLAQKTALLYPALKESSFDYDTSNTSSPQHFPSKNFGIWNYPLASLYIATSGENLTSLSTFGKKTLSMDYNFYFAHTQGNNLSLKTVISQLTAGGMSLKEAQEKAPSYYQKKIKQFEDETYWTYMQYFNTAYNGLRNPIHVGHHFSKWNGGAYWNAMKRFAESVCTKSDVECITYSELTSILEKNPKLSMEWNSNNSGRLPAEEKNIPEIKFNLLSDKFLTAEVVNHNVDPTLFKKSKLLWEVSFSDAQKLKSKGTIFPRFVKSIKRFFGIDFDSYKSKLNLKKVFDELKTNEANVRAIVGVKENKDDIGREILVATRIVKRDSKTGNFSISDKNLEDLAAEGKISDTHDEEN